MKQWIKGSPKSSDLRKIPAMEKSLTALVKNVERLNVQGDKQQQHQTLMKNLDRLNNRVKKQQQQHELLMKYIKELVDFSTTTSGLEGSSSKSKTNEQKKEESIATIIGHFGEAKADMKEEDDKAADRNKFKTVEMRVFGGNDPNSWLFRADRYFQIHKLTDSEKMTIFVISFDGSTLNWYHSQEERVKFKDWANLKLRLLERFCLIREGWIYSRFFAIKQTSTIKEYRNLFDRLVALLTDLSNKVLEETL